jgi:hypothetical protein
MRFLACQAFPVTLAEWLAPQRSLHRFFVVLLFAIRSRNIAPTRRDTLVSSLAVSVRAHRATSSSTVMVIFLNRAMRLALPVLHETWVARFSRNTTIVCFKYGWGDR